MPEIANYFKATHSQKERADMLCPPHPVLLFLLHDAQLERARYDKLGAVFHPRSDVLAVFSIAP